MRETNAKMATDAEKNTRNNPVIESADEAHIIYTERGSRTIEEYENRRLLETSQVVQTMELENLAFVGRHHDGWTVKCIMV